MNQLKKLFRDLTLVATGKPPLVTFSKALHFFLPDLVVPIDRKYMLNFFNGNVNINQNAENQLRLFCAIQKEFLSFAATHNLSEYIDDRWNLSIPKEMDNMIIGYMKL